MPNWNCTNPVLNNAIVHPPPRPGSKTKHLHSANRQSQAQRHPPRSMINDVRSTTMMSMCSSMPLPKYDDHSSTSRRNSNSENVPPPPQSLLPLSNGGSIESEESVLAAIKDTRNLFQGFLLKRKESLTHQECSFLESLKVQGGEDDLNRAMLVLSDRELFFQPTSTCTFQEKKNDCSDVVVDVDVDVDGMEMVEKGLSPSAIAIVEEEKDDQENGYEEDETGAELEESQGGVTCSGAEGGDVCEAPCDQFNVEIVDSEDGAIVLNDLKQAIQSYGSFHDDINFESPQIASNKAMINDCTGGDKDSADHQDSNNWGYYTAPVDRKASRAQSDGLGTSLRQSRVMERRGSSVHSSMWKAHRNGLSLSLTKTSSFRRSLFSPLRTNANPGSSPSPSPTPFLRTQRQTSVERANGISRKTTALRRTNHQSSSTLTLMSDLGESTSSFLSIPHGRPSPMDALDAREFMEDDTSVPSSVGMGAMELRRCHRRTMSSSSVNSTSSNSISNRGSYADTMLESLSTFQPLNLEVPSSKHGIPARVDNFESNESLSSSLSALDLAIGESKATNSSRLPPYIFSSRLYASRRGSESVASFPSIQQGHSFGGDSSTGEGVGGGGGGGGSIGFSLPSIRASQPIRQISSNSILSGQISTTSSVTLNTLSLRSVNVDNRSVPNTSLGSAASRSFRYPSPMRSHRNPSPLRSFRNPSPLSTRSRASPVPVLPPVHHMSSPIQEEDSLPKRKIIQRPKICQRKNSIASKIDVLETIFSQDEHVPKLINKKPGKKDENGVIFGGAKGERRSSVVLSTMIRKASLGNDNSHGLEVADANNQKAKVAMLRLERVESIPMNSRSVDDSIVTSSTGDLFKPELTFDLSDLKKSSSDHQMSPFRKGKSNLEHSELNLHSLLDGDADDQSWDLSNHDDVQQHYDPWNVLMDEYEEYEAFPFKILGTSADDVKSQPHVLSPPLMESLYHFLPFSVSDQNFYMKYSLIRDGDNFQTFLQNVRGSTHTILSLETTGGEVLGAFVSSQWRKSGSYYGSGESFLWRMKKDRKTVCGSVLDQAQLESEIEVFAWTGLNYLTQLITADKLVLGGGSIPGKEGGFGLWIHSNLLHGTSGFCATFGNPPLSKEHADGTQFEIVNLEVWTMTPADSEEEADKLEMARLFLESNRLR